MFAMRWTSRVDLSLRGGNNVNSKTDPEDRDYWATPNEIYRGALRYFVSKGMLPAHATYEVDVCANKHNTKHRRFIDEETDGTNLLCN